MKGLRKKRVSKRILSLVLVVAITVSGMSVDTRVRAVDTGVGAGTGTGTGTGAVAGAGIGDMVKNVSTGIGLFNGVTMITGKISNIIYGLNNMGQDATSMDPIYIIIDNIFGTNLQKKPTVSEQINQVYGKLEDVDDKITQLGQDVNEINGQLSVVNNKLDEVNSRLDRQEDSITEISENLSTLMETVEENQMSTSSQISDVSQRIESIIQNQTSELKVALFNSTIELKNATTLLNNLDKYYSYFDGLSSVEETILQDLSNFKKNITTFAQAVGELENSEEISEVINKCTLDYAEFYDGLSEEEKEILNTEVNLDGTGTVTVGGYLEDYLELLHTYMTETIYQKSSGYTSNIYDTVKLMGEYITGEVQSVGNVGVGEIFYQMSMLDKSTNTEVHEAYKGFMSTVLQDYYVTAYLCEMSLAYQIAYEKANDGNSVLISGYNERLNKVSEQVEKIQAYISYEFENCVRKYDFANYKDGEYEKSLCYYGNTVNASKGINGWKSVKKEEVYISAALSTDSMQLAVAEEKTLYFYQGLKERTDGVVWSSSDESIAVVNEDGTVSGVAPGRAMITAVFDEYTAYCIVVVGNCYAKKNGTETSNYFYGDKCYSLGATKGYDYYYNVDCYAGNEITLDYTNKSAGLVEATNLTKSDIELYTWGSTASHVADYIDGHITMTDNGACVIHGYRYLESEDVYECIAIPIKVTEDTNTEMEYDVETSLKDYSDYTKINTKEDLIALSQNPDGWGVDDKYVLTADIDLGGMEWQPIGYQFAMGSNSLYNSLEKWGYVAISQPFRGVFDGNGHEIKNFKITEIHYQKEMIAALETSYEKYNQENYFGVRYEIGVLSLGLFGCADGAIINNLKVSGGSIKLEEGITGDTFTVGDTDYTLKLADDAIVYAGLIAGNAAYNIGYSWKQERDKFVTSEVNGEELIKIAADADVSEYTKDMPEEIYSLGRSSGAFTQYVATKILEKDVNRVTYFDNCNVEGDINITAGQVCVGSMIGISNVDILNSSAKGTISTTATDGNGCVGGLAGTWIWASNKNIFNCTTNVQITTSGSDSTGGLLGDLKKGDQNDFSEFLVSAEEVKDADDAILEMTELRKELFMQMVYMMTEYNECLGSCDIVFDGEVENSNIKSCQVLGDITSDGYAGGIIGEKTVEYSDLKITMELVGETYQPVTTFYQTNVDIFECFVNANITTTGKCAGGVVGNAQRKIFEDDIDEESETQILGTIYAGEIKNCYIYGNITAIESAAGVAASQNASEYKTYTYDYMDISGIIVACEAITAINSAGDSAVYPIANPEFSGVTISNTCYYDNITYTYSLSGSPMYGATSKSNQGTAYSVTQLNNAGNYISVWGESFCDLNSLDFANGIIPTVLTERCFFNVEKAKKYYHVGETFEPIAEMILYTGIGSETVTEGISSTTPDMAEPGIRNVTVSYGNYEESYKVYIYPVEEAYIKVTEKPELTQEDDLYTISGGKIGVYLSDGSLSKTVDISECEKSYEDGYVKIAYNNLTTSMKILTMNVYSNSVVGEDVADLITTRYYLENDVVNRSEVIPESREVTYENKTAITNLISVTLEEDVKIASDTYVFALYEDVTIPEEPTTEEPTTEDVTTEEPTTEEVTTEEITTEEVTTEEPTTEKVTTEEPTTEEITTEEPTTEEPTTSTNIKPIAPSGGVDIGIGENGKFIVTWGQDDTMIGIGQLYNVYVDGVLVVENVVCGSYVIDLTFGKHKVEITAVLDGKESVPYTIEVIVVEKTTEEPTTKPQSTDNDEKKVYGKWEVYASGKIVNTKTKEVYLLTANTNEVSYEKCGTGTKVSIPEKIKINGKSYKVTSIAARAFKNNKKLKSIVIPKTVKKIGKQAFYGCKKLKKITIKTKLLKMKRVGSKAFAKIHKKPTIKVPKNKYKSYKKILRKRGVGKKAKWKKIR